MMADERKPIGYLMGCPIYADESLDTPREMYMVPLTEENAKQVAEKMAAHSIAGKVVRESPREGI